MTDAVRSWHRRCGIQRLRNDDMALYWHVVIDKANVGAAHIRNDLHLHGLQTAEQRGIVLAAGSRTLMHHRHVFLWDDSVAGTNGRQSLLAVTGDTVEVIVNWPHLTQPMRLLPTVTGTLRGDGGHHGPPSGISSNGAWAYPGAIERRWIFIVGRDSAQTPGFAQWQSGEGWP